MHSSFSPISTAWFSLLLCLLLAVVAELPGFCTAPRLARLYEGWFLWCRVPVAGDRGERLRSRVSFAVLLLTRPLVWVKALFPRIILVFHQRCFVGYRDRCYLLPCVPKVSIEVFSLNRFRIEQVYLRENICDENDRKQVKLLNTFVIRSFIWQRYRYFKRDSRESH